MEDKMLKHKKFEAEDNLNVAVNWLMDSVENLEGILNAVKNAKNEGDLWEALADGTLEDEMRDIEAALGYLKDAYDVADDELESKI